MAKRTRRCVDCKTDISNRGNKSTRCKACQAAFRRQRDEADPGRARCADDDGTCSPTRLKRGRCSRHYYTARRDNGWKIPQQPRTCVSCGEVFTPVRSDAVCCSSECNWRKQDALRKVAYPPKGCETCGTWFTPKHHRQRYCDIECIADPAARATRRWIRRNPASHSNSYHQRRLLMQAHPHSVGVTERDWSRLVNRYRRCCAYCGRPAVEITMDHVVPLARGGRHAIGNVLPACFECNSAKQDRWLIDFRRREKVNGPKRRKAKALLRQRMGGHRVGVGLVRYEQLTLGICGTPVRAGSGVPVPA